MYQEIRFSKLFNMVKGIYRKRSIKKRYGLSSTACFYQLHFGLRSLYIQKRKPSRKLGASWGDTWQNRMLKGLKRFKF